MKDCKSFGVTVVVGGTGTIGRAVVAACVRKGMKVMATFCKHCISTLPYSDCVTYVRCDLSEKTGLTRLLSALDAQGESVRGLAVCLPDDARGSYDESVRLLKLQIKVVETLARRMKMSGGGHIVMLSSTAAHLPFATGYSRFYAGAKGYVEAYVRAASGEFGPTVTINAIAPGIVHQGKVAKGGVHDQVDVSKIPLQQMMTAESVAEVILFHLRDGTMITGQIQVVDGGLTAVYSFGKRRTDGLQD